MWLDLGSFKALSDLLLYLSLEIKVTVYFADSVMLSGMELLFMEQRCCGDLFHYFLFSAYFYVLFFVVSYRCPLSTHPETRFIATLVSSPSTQTAGTLVFRTDVTRCGGLKVKSSQSVVICCWCLAIGTCFRRSLWFYCLYSLSGGVADQNFGLCSFV
jgi:hypothetical protein